MSIITELFFFFNPSYLDSLSHKLHWGDDMNFWKHNFRSILCLGALFVSCIAVCVAFSPEMLVAAGSWGLRFHEEGQQPIGNTSPSVLSAYDAVYAGDPEKPVLYLTFDAGYENGCTAQILDTLKRHQVPAAFFLVGHYLETNPQLVQRMVDEGHIVGNHTWSHCDMTQLSQKEAFSSQLQRLSDKFTEITGLEMAPYYRPPQGAYSEDNLKLAKELGYKTVFWSLAYADWDNDHQPTAEEAFSKLIPRVHNGAVVLLHSTSTTNAAILDELLTRWKEMGYTFAPIHELFIQ